MVMILPPVTMEPYHRFQVDLQQNHRNKHDVDRLLASIQKNGILQAVGAVCDPETGFLIPVWGYRRVLCAIRLELDEVPTRVFPGSLAPGERARLNLIENVQRQDLKPSEEARAYRALIDAEDLTAAQLAEALAVSEGKVSKKLALLKLIEPLLKLIDDSVLPETSGRELAKLDAEAQAELADQFAGVGRVSRTEANQAVQERLGRKRSRTSPRIAVRFGDVSVGIPAADTTLDDLASMLTELLKRAKKAQGEGLDLRQFAGQLRHMGAAR